MLAAGAEPQSALLAAKSLPKTLTKSVAGLVARGGSPVPEQWLVLTNDSKAASGVREFTVAKGVVVSSREGSDFASELTAENRLDLTKIRVDSDLATELTAAYAAVNSAVPASFDFDLRQAGTGAAPLWTVTALDNAGAKLGAVVVAADTGVVLSHEGFATQPDPADLTAEIKAPAADAEKKTSSSTKSRSSSSDGKRPDTWHRMGGHLQKFFTGKNTIGR